MERVSSFSTHGSRRGFVDDGTYLTEVDDLNRRALAHQIRLKQVRLKELREALGLKPGVHLKQMKRVKRWQEPLLFEASQLAKELDGLNLRLSEMPKKKPPRDIREAMLEVWEKLYPDDALLVRCEAQGLLARLEAQSNKGSDHN